MFASPSDNYALYIHYIIIPNMHALYKFSMRLMLVLTHACTNSRCVQCLYCQNMLASPIRQLCSLFPLYYYTQYACVYKFAMRLMLVLLKYARISHQITMFFISTILLYPIRMCVKIRDAFNVSTRSIENFVMQQKRSRAINQLKRLTLNNIFSKNLQNKTYLSTQNYCPHKINFILEKYYNFFIIQNIFQCQAFLQYYRSIVNFAAQCGNYAHVKLWR
eukprot:TRINITY_DN5110_c0_g1_i7.p2 TRINITY_DN5110_c0_g1~~TRINITY_DN5110_c0_g1_i7.p2  ORF type:complete len:219 (+),score=-20.90 TRINITY_DN5110_c0_g1_i7:1184-1840(+)